MQSFSSAKKIRLARSRRFEGSRKSTKRRSREEVELEKLRRQNARLEAELAKTKTALEITGKVHALLEQLSESADTDPASKP